MAREDEKTTFFSRRVVTLRSVGSAALPQVQLTELDFHTLGRAPENSIVLEHDTVSRRHAELCCVDDRFVIRDLGSGNGIIVSGRRVREHALTDGDQIELGECVLEFRDSATSRDRTSGNAAAEDPVRRNFFQPPSPEAARPLSARGFRLPRVSRTAARVGLVGVGVVLVVAMLVLAFQGRGKNEAARPAVAPVQTAVQYAAPHPTASRSNEEIEQRLAKASAQYQAGLLGQSLEEYRRAIEAGAADQDVRRTYERIAQEFEQRLQAHLSRADEYERHRQFRSAISELQGALALIGETADPRLAELQAKVGQLQQRL